MTRSALGISLFLFGTSTMLVAADALVEPEDGKKYRLLNVNSGLVLDVIDRSKNKGAGLIQAEADSSSTSQIWTVLKSNSGHKLVNENSGMVIDLPHNTKRKGVQLEQYESHGEENQQWFYKTFQTRGYVIYSANGQAVSIAGSSKKAGAKVIQFPWAGSAAQVWRFEPSDGVKK